MDPSRVNEYGYSKEMMEKRAAAAAGQPATSSAINNSQRIPLTENREIDSDAAGEPSATRVTSSSENLSKNRRPKSPRTKKDE